jgi:hypothetical protein
MLAKPVIPQVMEAIAGRKFKVVEARGRIKHEELYKCTLLHIRRKFFAPQTLPNALGLGVRVGEGADHGLTRVTALNGPLGSLYL